tara:strand:- start:118 stop:1350 length:1233 start_codon:yes stop_codon:yes gene_type:complete
MIKLYLVFIDGTVPILTGLVFNSLHTTNIFHSYIIFSIVLVIFSIMNGFYNNYYSIHFSEKIRISFITSFTVIFFQLIYYSYYSINISFLITLSWILIPIAILLTRYILKIYNKSVNVTTISIIGNLYDFRDYEIKILKDKKFKINFYTDLDQYFEKINYKPESSDLAVINYPATTFQDNDLLLTINTVSLSEFMEKYLRKIYLDEPYTYTHINTYNTSDFFIKRMIDYISVFILLPFLIASSIYVIIMKFLKGYGGSFIYTQKRYGMNQNIFNLIKLRTMHIDSDVDGNTVRNDERIYSFARNLRKYRLDELPQIINIFLGHMHLVGPRAEWVRLSNEYFESIDNYGLRNIVKPGITGWAQVLYQYGFNIQDSKQKLMYELYYIKNWSVWLELEICIKTITVILDKKGF